MTLIGVSLARCAFGIILLVTIFTELGSGLAVTKGMNAEEIHKKLIPLLKNMKGNPTGINVKAVTVTKVEQTHNIPIQPDGKPSMRDLETFVREIAGTTTESQKPIETSNKSTKKTDTNKKMSRHDHSSHIPNLELLQRLAANAIISTNFTQRNKQTISKSGQMASENILYSDTKTETIRTDRDRSTAWIDPVQKDSSKLLAKHRLDAVSTISNRERHAPFSEQKASYNYLNTQERDTAQNNQYVYSRDNKWLNTEQTSSNGRDLTSRGGHRSRQVDWANSDYSQRTQWKTERKHLIRDHMPHTIPSERSGQERKGYRHIQRESAIHKHRFVDSGQHYERSSTQSSPSHSSRYSQSFVNNENQLDLPSLTPIGDVATFDRMPNELISQLRDIQPPVERMRHRSEPMSYMPDAQKRIDQSQPNGAPYVRVTGYSTLGSNHGPGLLMKNRGGKVNEYNQPPQGDHISYPPEQQQYFDKPLPYSPQNRIHSRNSGYIVETGRAKQERGRPQHLDRVPPNHRYMSNQQPDQFGTQPKFPRATTTTSRTQNLHYHSSESSISPLHNEIHNMLQELDPLTKSDTAVHVPQSDSMYNGEIIKIGSLDLSSTPTRRSAFKRNVQIIDSAKPSDRADKTSTFQQYGSKVQLVNRQPGLRGDQTMSQRSQHIFRSSAQPGQNSHTLKLGFHSNNPSPDIQGINRNDKHPIIHAKIQNIVPYDLYLAPRSDSKGLQQATSQSHRQYILSYTNPQTPSIRLSSSDQQTQRQAKQADRYVQLDHNIGQQFTTGLNSNSYQVTSGKSAHSYSTHRRPSFQSGQQHLEQSSISNQQPLQPPYQLVYKQTTQHQQSNQNNQIYPANSLPNIIHLPSEQNTYISSPSSVQITPIKPPIQNKYIQPSQSVQTIRIQSPEYVGNKDSQSFQNTRIMPPQENLNTRIHVRQTQSPTPYQNAPIRPHTVRYSYRQPHQEVRNTLVQRQSVQHPNPPRAVQTRLPSPRAVQIHVQSPPQAVQTNIQPLPHTVQPPPRAVQIHVQPPPQTVQTNIQPLPHTVQPPPRAVQIHVQPPPQTVQTNIQPLPHTVQPPPRAVQIHVQPPPQTVQTNIQPLPHTVQPPPRAVQIHVQSPPQAVQAIMQPPPQTVQHTPHTVQIHVQPSPQTVQSHVQPTPQTVQTYVQLPHQTVQANAQLPPQTFQAHVQPLPQAVQTHVQPPQVDQNAHIQPHKPIQSTRASLPKTVKNIRIQTPQIFQDTPKTGPQAVQNTGIQPPRTTLNTDIHTSKAVRIHSPQTIQTIHIHSPKTVK